MKNPDYIKDLYKIGFLSDILIGLIDKLEGTPIYKQRLKNLLKQVLKELEKITSFHYEAHQNFGKLPNGENSEIDALDVYFITSKHYEELFELMTSSSIDKIVRILEIYKNTSEADFEQVSVKYEPVK